MERQRRIAQEQLEAQQRANRNVELHNAAIMELLQTAERQYSFVTEKSQLERDRQHELVNKTMHGLYGKGSWCRPCYEFHWSKLPGCTGLLGSTPPVLTLERCHIFCKQEFKYSVIP